MPPTILVATPADAATLATLGRETFVETWVDTFAMGYPPDDLATHLAEAFDPAVIASSLAAQRSRWLVSVSGPTAVAYAQCGPCGLPHPDVRQGEGELKRLYVRRAYQGLGLGRLLLEKSLAWLEANFAGPAWLGVWSGNLKAQKLYAAFGFRKVGEYDYPVGRTLDREHIFRRERAASSHGSRTRPE